MTITNMVMRAINGANEMTGHIENFCRTYKKFENLAQMR